MKTKAELKRRLKELYEGEDLTQQQIANILDAEGFLNDRGGRYTQSSVSRLAIKLKVGRRNKRKRRTKVRSQAAKRSSEKKTQVSSNRNEDDKMAMIELFLGLNFTASSSKKLKYIENVINL